MTIVKELAKYIQLPVADELFQAPRLFHGRGHGYPGLHHITIDWLPPVILITLFAEESASELKVLAQHIQSLMPACKSIQLQHRYQLLGPIEIMWGDNIQNLTVHEQNLQFNIQLGNARNIGLFLDMKNGRQWVQENCKHKRVLNLFAYTCGFSVAAVAGSAKSVLNIDMSRAALNKGRENLRLNLTAWGDKIQTQVTYDKLNILKSFSRLKKRGPFDLLICDPPTFQKGSVNIVKDYPKILRRLDEFMALNSTLLLCLNAPELGREFLIDLMSCCAPDYQFVDEINPPPVYVEKEAKGLKILCYKRSVL